LEVWRDADPAFQQLVDAARQRLAGLTTTSTRTR